MYLIDRAKEYLEENLSPRDKTNMLGIDIGASSIKVVQLKKEQEKVELITYGETALGPFGDKDVGDAPSLPVAVLAKALSDLLQAANVTTKNCGVSVPFAASLIRLIEVPALDTQKLNTVIPLEARKYIPVPMSEVQLDWFVVPETEQRLFSGTNDPYAPQDEAVVRQKRLALVVAMHNETLRRYTEVLSQTGLKPLFYEIEVFSTIRATIARSLAPVAIIDLGAVTSNVYLVELGIVLASHVIPSGSRDITQALVKSLHMSPAKAEELKRQAGILSGTTNDDMARVSHAATLTMERIFADARRVLLGFQQKNNKVITKVILTGGGAALQGIEDFGRERLEIETEIANPFTHVETPSYLEKLLSRASPDFTVATGLALRTVKG